MYAIDDYNYDLPDALIAQQPAARREQSRLLYLNKTSGEVAHLAFSDICDQLDPTDVLVVNNTRVIPGRLMGRKQTGGRVEVLILDYPAGSEAFRLTGDLVFQCLVRASIRPKPGTVLTFDSGVSATVEDFRDGVFTVRFSVDGDFESALSRIGKMPLPPYIRRSEKEAAPCDDEKTYQTVYAEQRGAIAAPTAGLHFSEALLDRIRQQGVAVAVITLHVGYGTFLPVRVTDIRDHAMHAEYFEVPASAADAINRARAAGGRVIAVGTTSVRTLEWASDETGTIAPGRGQCDLFIYPGYRFKMVDAMITNFHLPKSTLLMLVSAFAGRNRILNAYREAICHRYRFFSYGDAMFIS